MMSDGWAPVAIARAESKAAPVSEEIVIGKDVLELLTGAMYSEPLMIYREYVQNAVDATDEHFATPHDAEKEPPRIDITIDAAGRSVLIRDTGCGIAREDFERRLTALGASPKRGHSKRGFRGVGRLSGLGYCRELVFRSRRSRRDPVLELSWDGRRLRELLRDAAYKHDLRSLIKEITSVRTISGASYPSRFFEVEMRGVTRVKNDALLNPAVIASYLSEVGPLAFDPGFTHGRGIEDLLANYGIRAPARLMISDGKSQCEVFRPHRNEVPISIASPAGAIECLSIEGLDDQVAAVGWILHHDYLGSIPREKSIEGIRVRCGNIQIGNSRLLDDLFIEPRFNSWCVGEIHVLSQKIVPNGRRDNFEANAAWQDLQGKLAAIASTLSKRCRSRSIARNRLNDLRRDYQATMDLLDLVEFQSRYGLSPKDASSVVATAIDGLQRKVSAPHTSEEVRAEAAACMTKLKARMKRTTGRTQADPLAFLSSHKRAAYREIFGDMLRSGRSARECIELIDSLVSLAKRRAKGARTA